MNRGVLAAALCSAVRGEVRPDPGSRALYATFSPGRNWDQFRVSVAYTVANVKVAGAHAGLSVGPDGAIHQAMDDIAITWVLPNVTVVVPCGYCETIKATRAIAACQGPAYMRFGRTETPAFTTPDSPFCLGRAEVLRDGGHLAIVSCGPLVTRRSWRPVTCMARLSRRGSSTATRSSPSMSRRSPQRSARPAGSSPSRSTRSVHGGLGGAVAETLAAHHPAPIEMVAMPDHFGDSGPPGELLAKWGLTAPSIAEAARRLLSRKGADERDW